MGRRAGILLASIRERIIAPDPGLLRLHFALRVVCSAALTLFTLMDPVAMDSAAVTAQRRVHADVHMLSRTLAGTFHDRS